MNERMPCSITDGEQYDDQFDRVEPEDEDAAYERHRQYEIDDAAFALEYAKRRLTDEIQTEGEAILLRNILRIIQGKEE